MKSTSLIVALLLLCTACNGGLLDKYKAENSRLKKQNSALQKELIEAKEKLEKLKSLEAELQTANNKIYELQQVIVDWKEKATDLNYNMEVAKEKLNNPRDVMVSGIPCNCVPRAQQDYHDVLNQYRLQIEGTTNPAKQESLNLQAKKYIIGYWSRVKSVPKWCGVVESIGEDGGIAITAEIYGYKSIYHTARLDGAMGNVGQPAIPQAVANTIMSLEIGDLVSFSGKPQKVGTSTVADELMDIAYVSIYISDLRPIDAKKTAGSRIKTKKTVYLSR